jgi:hypothetical protein
MIGKRKRILINTLTGTDQEFKDVVVQITPNNTIVYWTDKDSVLHRRISNMFEKTDITTKANPLDRYSYNYLLKLGEQKPEIMPNQWNVFNSLKQNLGSLWVNSQASLSSTYITNRSLILKSLLATGAFYIWSLYSNKANQNRVAPPRRYMY